ncbi:hypothetical protein chiPu_0010700 [Chiloscyllium punctatum]|uniref:Uncharacterized protein n=1 Tax=Chiloscyllium punctatum TaxID=137246 RepID=A0A401SPB2_CHIPU|nr:hypothetical protein [Chiloscyllium punctatum]
METPGLLRPVQPVPVFARNKAQLPLMLRAQAAVQAEGKGVGKEVEAARRSCWWLGWVGNTAARKDKRNDKTKSANTRAAPIERERALKFGACNRVGKTRTVQVFDERLVCTRTKE